MPHRDPQTGKFVSSDGHDHHVPRYSDLEWTSFRMGLSGEGGATITNQTLIDQRAIDTQNAPPDDLDHSELAELVVFDLKAVFKFVFDGNSTGNQSGEGRLSFGINMACAESPVENPDTDVANQDAECTASGDEFAQAVSIGDPEDDTGILYGSYFGLGGSVTVDRSEHYRNFRREYQHGPVLDQNDDLTHTMRVDEREQEDLFELFYVVRLGWLIHEVEGTRPRLGIFD